MRIGVPLSIVGQHSERQRAAKPLSARELVRDAHKYADLVSEKGVIGPADVTTISDIRYGVVSFESATLKRFGKDEERSNA